MNIHKQIKIREKLFAYKYKVEDNSLTTKYLSDFWNYIVNYIPKIISPNMISLCGFLCNCSAFYFRNKNPIISGLSIFLYMNLDCLDGKQARRLRLGSPVGELVDHVLDASSIGLIMSSFSCWYNFSDPVKSLLISIVQTMFLNSQLDAYKNKELKFGLFSTNEALIILSLFGIFNKNIYLNKFMFLLHDIIHAKIPFVYLGIVAYIGYKLYTNSYKSPNLQLTPLLMLNYLYPQYAVINNGIFANLCTDTIVAKMLENKKISFPISSLTGLQYLSMKNSHFNKMTKINSLIHEFSYFHYLGGILGYYNSFRTVKYIAQCTNYSLWKLNLNVYVDGVFDLTHTGHFKIFANACNFKYLSKLKAIPKKINDEDTNDYSTFQGINVMKNYKQNFVHLRTIVGIPSEKDVTEYKRPQVLSIEDKKYAIENNKFVSGIILNAPCNGISEEFLIKNSLHFVLHGDDMNINQLNKYYNGAIKRNSLIITPYTPGISTSDILKKACEIYLNK